MSFYIPLLTLIITSMLSGLLVMNSKRIIRHMVAYKKTERHLHEKNTLRLGGFILIIGMIAWSILQNTESDPLATVILRNFFFCIVPLLLLTALEDLHIDTPPKYRLLLTIVSSIAIYYFLPMEFFTELNWGHKNIITIATIIIITTMSIQATNLIDGANGIVLLNSIMVLLVIYFLSCHFNNATLADLSASSLMVILFFLPWNYPYAKLFCGDTGAYAIGAFLSFISSLIYISHDDINIAFLFTIFSYPLYEISFTVLRRLATKKPIFMADNKHLHHLLFQKFKSDDTNSYSSKINNLLAPTILSIQIPALLGCLLYPQSFMVLSSLFVITYLSYTFLYFFLRDQKGSIL